MLSNRTYPFLRPLREEELN